MPRTHRSRARLTLALVILLAFGGMHIAQADWSISHIHYTFAQGYFPSVGSASGIIRSTLRVAFEASEVAVGADLNGDGDETDTGIFVHDRETDKITLISVAHADLRGATDTTILFAIPEGELAEDYNGDGQITDAAIPGVVDLASEQVSYLRVPPLAPLFNADGPWMRIDGDYVLMVFPDGVGAYDLTTDTLIDTPIPAGFPAIDAGVIAFITDTHTLGYYRTDSGEVVDTGEVVRAYEEPTDIELSVSRPWIAFINYEPYVREDLNDDGVLGEVVGIHNLDTGGTQYLPAGVGSTIIGGHDSVFTVDEVEDGQDANGDGDHRDQLLGAYNLFNKSIEYHALDTPMRLLTAVDAIIAGAVSEMIAARDLNGDGRLNLKPILVYLTMSPTDTTKPTISIRVPTATTYTLREPVVADYTCQDESGGSGIASCESRIADGATLWTNTVGAKTVWITATDQAGNVRHTPMRCIVSYGICTSFDESQEYPAWRTLSIPIELCDAHGRNVSHASVQMRLVGLSSGVLPEGALARFTTNNGTVKGYVLRLPLRELAQGEHVLSFMAEADPTVHTLTIRVVDDTTPNGDVPSRS
jgi:hypothetical protein